MALRQVVGHLQEEFNGDIELDSSWHSVSHVFPAPAL
jgi:hypothetical protein